MNQSHLSVKYIGKRAEYIDGTYGTRIHWVQGQSHQVPTASAVLMLKHPDVYVRGDVDAPVASVPSTETQEEDATQDMRDALSVMDKASLTTYAKTHFQIKLDQRKELTALRSQVTGLIDQYGVV